MTRSGGQLCLRPARPRPHCRDRIRLSFGDDDRLSAACPAHGPIEGRPANRLCNRPPCCPRPAWLRPHRPQPVQPLQLGAPPPYKKTGRSRMLMLLSATCMAAARSQPRHRRVQQQGVHRCPWLGQPWPHRSRSPGRHRGHSRGLSAAPPAAAPSEGRNRLPCLHAAVCPRPVRPRPHRRTQPPRDALYVVTCPRSARPWPHRGGAHSPEEVERLRSVRGMPGRGPIAERCCSPARRSRRTWFSCWPRLPVHGHPAEAPSQLGRGPRCKPRHGDCPRSARPRPHRRYGPDNLTTLRVDLSATCFRRRPAGPRPHRRTQRMTPVRCAVGTVRGLVGRGPIAGGTHTCLRARR
jgi:hypothetical protein